MTYSETIAKMRTADVTSANAATPWARETFRLLLERNDEGEPTFTYPMAVAAVCKVYVHTTNKGKPGATTGSLKDGGFPAISARLTTVKRISEQLGVAGVKPLVAAFLASERPSDTFAKLDSEVRDAVKEAGKAWITAEDTPPAEDTLAMDVAMVARHNLADALADAADLIESMTGDDVAGNGDVLARLMAAIGAAWALEAESIAQAA